MKKLTPYEIIQEPVYTEKADRLREEGNWYTFKVHPHVNKIMVRQAIEELFSVTVKKVRIVRHKPKPRGRLWRRGRRGYKPAWKKAYVKIAEGQSIDIYKF